jgi:hypothetical protein
MVPDLVLDDCSGYAEARDEVRVGGSHILKNYVYDL